MKQLIELAKLRCPDYPFSEEPTEGECLWALDCALRGTLSANESCHAFIQHLGSLLGWDNERLAQEWEGLNHAATVKRK